MSIYSTVYGLFKFSPPVFFAGIKEVSRKLVMLNLNIPLKTEVFAPDNTHR